MTYICSLTREGDKDLRLYIIAHKMKLANIQATVSNLWFAHTVNYRCASVAAEAVTKGDLIENK